MESKPELQTSRDRPRTQVSWFPIQCCLHWMQNDVGHISKNTSPIVLTNWYFEIWTVFRRYGRTSSKMIALFTSATWSKAIRLNQSILEPFSKNKSFNGYCHRHLSPDPGSYPCPITFPSSILFHLSFWDTGKHPGFIHETKWVIIFQTRKRWY